MDSTKQLTFLGEFYAFSLVNVLEELNTSKKEGELSVQFNIDDPESAFNWGKLLSYVSVITAFHEEFNVNLLTYGVSDEKFAQELFDLCVNIAQERQSAMDNEEESVEG